MKYFFQLSFLFLTILCHDLNAQTWIWGAQHVPNTSQGDDGRPVNLGVRFRSSSAGYIKAIRFWKQPGNSGTHLGSIWTTDGTQLGQIVFSNETQSGWQTAYFSTPIAIQANTTYIASYFCPTGTYSRQSGYFNSAGGTGTVQENPPLMAPADGLFGPNGLYAYASNNAFPNQSAFSTNYWVDVFFEPSGTPSTPSPNPPSTTGTTWIWPETHNPNPGVGDDGQSVNLGVRFRSSQDGYIQSIRFWKRQGNSGTHIGAIWSSSGTLLAEAIFTNESATGWQTVSFSTPVPITANTNYIASYFCPAGQYSREANYFNANSGTGTVNFNPPLEAPADGLFGPNGLYAYASGNRFPDKSASSTNYWVDVQFVPTTSTEPAPPPPPPPPPSTGLTGTNTWIWPQDYSPLAGIGDDGRPVNLGLRFRSSTDGQVKGIRFWKVAGITGTHTGTVWSESGQRLGEVTFSGETSSGWQTAMFSSPIPIQANTNYIASYFCPTGKYTRQADYFSSSRGTGTYSANPPLSAPANGAYGPNGLYLYSGSPAFPTQSASSSNYWVDVLFESGSSTGGTTNPPATGGQGTRSYSVPVIPFSDPDLTSPFRAGELWHYGPENLRINAPSDNQFVQPMDFYQRLRWDQLESSMGNYTFDFITNMFNDAITKKQKVSLGVMVQLPGQEEGPMANGARMAYPMYLHNLMQGDATNARDWVSPRDPSIWVPNYNSGYFLARFEALLMALAQHINNNSYNGVRYRDVLGYVDIRGYGSWGEWNMVNIASTSADYPVGRLPQSSSLIRIVDAHRSAFPNNPLVAMIASFDGNRYPNIQVPPEVGYHILTTSNNWGKIGWRMDSYGWTDAYIRALLEENTVVYNGMRFDTAIMNRYRYAPIVGEGPCGGTSNGGPHPFWYFPAQVRKYHTSILGNGNWCGEHNSGMSARDSVRMAWKLSGYRLQVESIDITNNIVAGSTITLAAKWKNAGIAPVYENWIVRYGLENESTGQTLWTGNSTISLRNLQPGNSAVSHTDGFTMPASMPPGNYRMVLRITDPSGFRAPLTLANFGRRSDGAYVLAQGLVIYSSNQDLPPSVNAGADFSVPSSAGTITLTGTATDVEGPVLFQWTKISGPAGGTIVTSTSQSTQVTGIQAGVYLFRLKVTDNIGQTAEDDMVVIVYNPGMAVQSGSMLTEDMVRSGGEKSLPKWYPVPLQQGAPLTITFENSARYTCELYSSDGRKLRQKTGLGITKMDTYGLAPGTYILRIHSGAQVWLGKIMITP